MTSIRIVDAQQLGGRDFTAALELQQGLDQKRDPALPTTTAAELRAIFDEDNTEHARHQRTVAFRGGRAVAIGHLQLSVDPANAAVAVLEITSTDGADGATDADDVSAVVLVRLLQQAQADGRSSIIAFGDLTIEAEAFWADLGAELRYTEQEASLHLAEVNPRLMQQWIDEAPPGVELLHWSEHCPDKWLDHLVATTNAMNDAPTDDLEIADTIVDASMMQTEIKAQAAHGLEYQGVFAVAFDGGAAGATEVLINRHRPACSWQWNTVVLPAYRGRGIGRWMKAAMWQRLRSAEPEVTALHTGNAASNTHMLAINTRMGYRPTHLTACWQSDLRQLLERLQTSKRPT